MYMANLRTNIVDFRGFDSSIILISRGGILRPIGDSKKISIYIYMYIYISLPLSLSIYIYSLGPVHEDHLLPGLPDPGRLRGPLRDGRLRGGRPLLVGLYNYYYYHYYEYLYYYYYNHYYYYYYHYYHYYYY